MEYTEKIRSELYEGKFGKYDTSEENFSELIEYLNSSEFRSFGKGLSVIIRLKADSDETDLECLKRCFKNTHIDIKELGSPNTPKNWFNGGERPKKGEDSRRKMFVLAFVLGLDADETAYLFQKVFLDRAFNPRNYKELIYYYCIENKLPFSKAEEMISQVSIDSANASDSTVYTKMIADVIKETKSNEEIVEYINSHPHNFSISSIAAKERVEEYINRAKNEIWSEIGIKYTFESGEFIPIQETRSVSYEEYVSEKLDRDKLIVPEQKKDIIEKKDLTSVNFMYEQIIGQSLEGSVGTGSSLLKNVDLPKEILASFPTPQIFAKIHKNATYDELRKMLILLFSFWFWRQIQKKNDYANIDDYTEQLNALLTDTNLPELYPGNPFDWLFCFCTMTDNPLDTFRAILAEVLETEE